MLTILPSLAGPCTACGSTKVHYSFSVGPLRVEECPVCRLMRVNPQPAELSGSVGTAEGTAAVAIADYGDLLTRFSGKPTSGRILEVGLALGGSAGSATVARIGSESPAAIPRELSALRASGEQFDVVVLGNVMQRVSDPRSLLASAWTLLAPDGIIVVTVPNSDSLSARLMGDAWTEFRPEYLWYFAPENLLRLMRSEGFGALQIYPARNSLTVGELSEHFDEKPVRPISSVVHILNRAVPGIGARRAPMTSTGMVVIGQRVEARTPRILSVVMPVFNEGATVAAGIERVLSKRVPGVKIELIIVESNSTDDSRAVVQSFAGRDNVRVVLEDRPRGKGYAVRTGLKAATGDYILIQDADDEYDIEDYDALLEPLLSGESAFVLGARHGGGAWKMRQFTGQPIVSAVLNFGHWGFATLINVLYGVRLKDPFTMYKVFRTDCLKGLTFECNRFDFDPELVIKLVRKGYIPMEIPVNYRSRSFKEGKKVNAWRDPLTWLTAIVKYRFQQI